MPPKDETVDEPYLPPPTPVPSPRPRRPFLSIWYHCCHAYGRLYRNSAGTRYEGRCPRCGNAVDAHIGPNGTSRRMFEAL